MIRDMTPEDVPEVLLLHAESGLDYTMYDLNSPLCIVKKVRVEGGRIVGAMIGRLTMETLLVVSGGPVARGRSIEELEPEVLSEAYLKGLDETACVIPPEILDSFEPVLERLHWERDRAGWVLFTRQTGVKECAVP